MYINLIRLKNEIYLYLTAMPLDSDKMFKINFHLWERAEHAQVRSLLHRNRKTVESNNWPRACFPRFFCGLSLNS